MSRYVRTTKIHDFLHVLSLSFTPFPVRHVVRLWKYEHATHDFEFVGMPQLLLLGVECKVSLLWNHLLNTGESNVVYDSIVYDALA